MAFFESLEKELTNISKGAIQKTKDMSGTVKNSVAIKELEEQRKKHFTQLGELYYYYLQAAEDDSKTAALSHDMKQIVANVDQINQDIAAHQEQLTQLKGTVRCAVCNAEISKNAMFCTSCGTKVEVKTETKQESQSADVLKCPSCGAQVVEGQLFCTLCGNSLR